MLVCLGYGRDGAERLLTIGLEPADLTALRDGLCLSLPLDCEERRSVTVVQGDSRDAIKRLFAQAMPDALFEDEHGDMSWALVPDDPWQVTDPG